MNIKKDNEVLVISKLLPKETEKIKKHVYNKYNDWNYYDYISAERKLVIEVKIRSFDIETYQNQYNQDPMIEVEKYKKCMLLAKRLKYKFIYVLAFTNNNKIENIEAYDLTSIDESTLKKEPLYMPNTSTGTNSIVIEKEVFIINHEKFDSNSRYSKKIT